MRINYFLIFISFFFCTSAYSITITEGMYRGIEHFIVYTKNATYYYDKAGGAFTRIVDRQGIDWVDFQKEPWNEYPESAASSYRGIPNLVSQSEDNGVGTPGYDKCISRKLNRRTIETISKSQKWKWIWVFNNKFAELIIEQIDTDHKYKFMYNGVIGGRYNPENQYYGTNLGGPSFKVYNMQEGEKIYGNWQWSYFGDRDIKRVFFVAQATPEHHIDSYSFLGNSEKGVYSDDGMVSFGFGVKENFTPELEEENARFYIGFINKRIEKPNDHVKIKKIIEGIIK